MKRRIWIPVIAALLVITSVKISKAQEKDFGTWLTVNITKDLTKRLELEFEEEVRIVRDFGKISRFGTSAGLSYQLANFLKAAAGYEWLYRHDINDDLWDNRHRVYFQLVAKAKLGRIDVSLKEKFQSTYINEDIKGFDYSPENYLRSRLQVAWDIKGSKMEPYASVEMHNQLNNPDGNSIDDWRYTAGVEFPLAKKLDLDTYLRLDHEQNVKNPVDLYLIGINLKWKL